MASTFSFGFHDADTEEDTDLEDPMDIVNGLWQDTGPRLTEPKLLSLNDMV